MYIIQLDDDSRFKKKKLREENSLIDEKCRWGEPSWLSFTEKVDEDCIEIPDFYEEPYWYYEFDIPDGEWIKLDSYDYIADEAARGISNKRLTYEDMSDGVMILEEKCIDNKVDWDKVKKYIEFRKYLIENLSLNEQQIKEADKILTDKLLEYMETSSPIDDNDEQLLYISLKKTSESSMDDYMTFCQLLNDKEARVYRYNNELFIYLANAKEHITSEQLSSFNFIRRCLVNNEKVYAKWNKRAERIADIEKLRYSFLYNLIK